MLMYRYPMHENSNSDRGHGEFRVKVSAMGSKASSLDWHHLRPKLFRFSLLAFCAMGATSCSFAKFSSGTCIEDQVSQVVWHVDSARNKGAYLLTSVKGHGTVYPKGSSMAFPVSTIEEKGAYLPVPCPRERAADFQPALSRRTSKHASSKEDAR